MYIHNRNSNIEFDYIAQKEIYLEVNMKYYGNTFESFYPTSIFDERPRTINVWEEFGYGQN